MESLAGEFDLGDADFYRMIFDLAEEGIAILDSEDRITVTNGRFLEFLGYGRDEMAGRRLYEFTDEKSAGYLREKLAARHRGRRAVYPLKLARKDGGFLWFLVAATPIFGRDDRYAGALAMYTDITREKEATDALERAKDAAELYLDLMSHDLNNLNQVAVGYLELAEEKIRRGGLGPGDVDLVSKPTRELNRASELIRDVKVLQSMGERQERVPVDLAGLLQELRDEYSRSGGEATVRVRGPPGVKVRADSLLREVFANLIGNAIKHAGRPVTVDVAYRLVDRGRRECCEISVADDGPGIPDDIKAAIFRRYARGRTRARGTGLGLYLVRALVDSYHGEVRVEDRVPGDYAKGAKFVIWLPVAE